MAAKNKSNKIEIIRVYNAPVKMVWDAWTDPQQAAKWWGPRGFTITTHSKELKPGGIWHYTMHGPDGKEWINKTLYHQVEKYALLVYDHGGNDEQAPLFRVTAKFSEQKGNKTLLEMSFELPSVEAAEQTRKFIKAAGGDSTWDRLGEYLAKETEQKEKFIINRSFDAPLETMYEMWADPKHFSKWLPPTGFDMEFIRADIRPGGNSFYFMSNSSGMKMYGKVNYLDFQKPNRLSYTQQFCDQNEVTSRHPLAPTWPETMLTTVELTAEGPERTRITITWECVGQVTKEELETFIQGRAGMTGGWTGSFDKLEEYLLSRG